MADPSSVRSSESLPTPSTIGYSQEELNLNAFHNSPNFAQKMMPLMYPLLVPGSAFLQNPEQNDLGAGLYAVPFSPSVGPAAWCSPTPLVPIRYRIPTRTSSVGVTGEETGQEARQQHRQVAVRNYHVAFRIDLGLLLKLVFAVCLLGQDGSRLKLTFLVLSAILIYLYQTGVLPPVARWVRRRDPPQPHPAAQPVNGPPLGNNGGNAPRPEENTGDENENQNRDQPAAEAEGPRPIVNENQPEPERGINWLGIAKEIQTIVVGFVVSLLPGFHNHD